MSGHGKTDFPEIRHIDDVLPAIDGQKEFALFEKPEYIAIDYHFQTEKTFADPESDARSLALRRECRGIKFDPASGALISRPYHKFFNLNEAPETTTVAWNDTHVVLEKLDGSMIAPCHAGGRLTWLSRIASVGPAAAAQAFVEERRDIGYDAFCHALLAEGLQPIFEWCSPDWRIVVDYPETKLVLTAVRDMLSGAYRPMDDLRTLAAPHDVPVAGVWGQGVGDVETFLDHTRGLPDDEGYVIRFDDGMMIKLKAEAYVARHSAKSLLDHEKKILDLVIRGAEDDLVSLLEAKHAAMVSAYATKVREGILETARRVEAIVADAGREHGDDRGAFARNVAPGLAPPMRHLAFAFMDGKDLVAETTKLVGKHTRAATDIDRVRALIGEARWEGGTWL